MTEPWRYAAEFASDSGSILVTFPDIPEAVTGGADAKEAANNAVDALEVALLTYAKDGRPFPSRSSMRSGQRLIAVSASTAAKLAFIEAFRAAGETRVGLAQRLGKAESEVRRMLDPYHATKLPALEAGLAALGRRLVVSVEAA